LCHEKEELKEEQHEKGKLKEKQEEKEENKNKGGLACLTRGY